MNGKIWSELRRRYAGVLLLALVVFAGTVPGVASVQTSAAGQTNTAKPADAGDDDPDAKIVTVSATSTPQEREHAAWALLDEAMADAKRPQTRIQGLAALGMLRTPRSEKMIAEAMKDPELDVRTAAALAAGQTRDRNLTTDIRNLLDDKEPQVAFTAAMTLWKMGDKSGEDILMAVVDGERSAGPTLVNGTKHDISKELHDPAAMTKLAVLQGASMLLGPFGFGIAAFEYIRKNGGDASRVAAIEAIAQEKTEPIHQELLGALADKDPTVRAAAAKALVDYRDKATSIAIYGLFADAKQPVRLTAAAAYLRSTGVPGPVVPAVGAGMSKSAGSSKH